MTNIRAWVCGGAAAFLFIPQGAHSAPLPGSRKEAGQKIERILKQMTLEEKIGQLHGIEDKQHYRYVPPVPRLGIPALSITNGPAGVGPGGAGPQSPATALPAPLALAATWDLHLADLYGVVAGREARDLGYDLLESPDVNIARIPQNGRTFESFGEDPWLAARIAVAEIRGIQKQGVIANVKHYALNSQETDRGFIDAIVDEKTLREIYLPPFEAAVKQADVGSVMCAYPRVNSLYNCENGFLLHHVLKDQWQFQGFVTSDFGAVHGTVGPALKGLDLELPTGKYFGEKLQQAVLSGEVPESTIDDKLRRRFEIMQRFGLFGPPRPKVPIPVQQDGALARKIAEEAMVLLKNDGALLPLDRRSLKTIALLGPCAAKASTGGGGSSHVVPLYTVSPLDGLRRRAGDGVKILTDDGKDVTAAAALARSATVAIVMVGDDREEGKDAPIALSGNQDALVDAVAQANAHTIVVVKSGSAILMPWASRVPAILEAWYPGEEDGNAVPAVLFGDVNPSGKLPLTFPKDLTQLAAHSPQQYPGVDGTVHYTEGVYVGYRHYDAANLVPRFPFGFGLSYTTFRLQDFQVSQDQAAPKQSSSSLIRISFAVKNVGRRAGAEVAQLYVGIPAPGGAPPRQLKAFQKVYLAPGASARVSFSLDRRALSCWDSKQKQWILPAGEYRLYIGSSSRDIAWTNSVTLR